MCVFNFELITDGVSMMKIELKAQTPRLHYVHPTYFEAGKPMEFIACGSNLMKPKFQYENFTFSTCHMEKFCNAYVILFTAIYINVCVYVCAC